MKALGRSLIYFFAAGMYFYHLGAWTYRTKGVALAQLESYPPEVMIITYAYFCVILVFVFVFVGFLSAINNSVCLRVSFALLFIPLVYEAYRVFGTLSAYGVADPEIFYAHLGIRLSLGVVVVFCFYHGWYLQKNHKKVFN